MTVTKRAAAERAATLVEALPYIRRFAGQVVVVKYGGNALAGASDDHALALFAQDIVLMHQVGMRPVVVHSGGPQISELLGRLGMTSEFRKGLRVTDGETIDVVRMVLIGQVNAQIVAAINMHGPLAVGVSGEDAALIRAVARDADLGFVGDVESINPTILNALLGDGFIPVVATIEHQRRHGRRCHRRGARGREARVPHRHRGVAPRRRRRAVVDPSDDPR